MAFNVQFRGEHILYDKGQDRVRVWNVHPNTLDSDGNPKIIEIKTRIMQLPKLGEWVTLPPSWVKDIKAKTLAMGHGREPVMLTDEEGGERLAGIVLEAYNNALESGVNPSTLDMNKINSQAAVKQMSEDDLLTAMKAKGLSKEDLERMASLLNDETDTTPQKTKSTPRKKDTE